MTRQETILTIRESLKKLFSATNLKFSDFVLTDGTKITTTASDLEIGVEVYAVDEMGNQSPLDNGDYVINDGRTITVADNKITNVSGETSTEDESPVSDAMDTTSGQEPKDAPKMEKMTDGMADAPSDESDLAQRVSDLEAHLEEILNLLKQMSEAQTSTTQQMMSRINTLSEEPGDVAIKSTKKGYEEYSSKKISQRKNMSEIEELRKIMAERHKRDNNMAL